MLRATCILFLFSGGVDLFIYYCILYTVFYLVIFLNQFIGDGNMLNTQLFVCDKWQIFHPFCHLSALFELCYSVLYHAELLWTLNYLLLFSHSVVSDALQPHGLQHTRLPVLHHLPELAQIMFIELVMPYNHLVLCRPLLLLPSIFPCIRVSSNESALCSK